MKITGPIRTAGYTLVHEQTFLSEADLDPLNRKYIWAYETIINNERQMYDPRAVGVGEIDGVSALTLTFSAVGDVLSDNGNTKGTYNGQPRDQKYYSGVVTSFRHFQIGPFFKATIRARLAPGEGMWSALWFLAIRDRWPAGQGQLDEIDIVEALGREGADWFHTAQHQFKGKVRHWKHDENRPGVDIYNEFHDYTLEITPSAVKVGFDDEYFVAFPFPEEWANHEWHWLANVAGGGSWAGPVNDDDLPSTMYVESVKFWQTSEFISEDKVEDEGDARSNNPDNPPVEGQNEELPADDPEPSEADEADEDEQPTSEPLPSTPENEEPEVEPIEPAEREPEDEGWGFEVDSGTKALSWNKQRGAVKYNVYRNGRYMTQVTGTSYRPLQPGNFMVQGIKKSGHFLDRSTSILID